MNKNYRYNPEDFRGMLGLTDDLGVFYRLHEAYCENKTRRNWFALEKQWEDLFFTIKHRELEGYLNHTTAADLRGYMEELLYD